MAGADQRGGGAGTAVAAGRFSWMVALGLLLAAWVFTTVVVLLLQRARAGAGQLARQPRSFWGMVVAHAGVGVFIVGVTDCGWATSPSTT